MIGDYEFDHSPQSVALLTELAKVAAAAHCPFITSSSPSIMQMNNWRSWVTQGISANLYHT